MIHKKVDHKKRMKNMFNEVSTGRDKTWKNKGEIDQ